MCILCNYHNNSLPPDSISQLFKKCPGGRGVACLQTPLAVLSIVMDGIENSKNQYGINEIIEVIFAIGIVIMYI